MQTDDLMTVHKVRDANLAELLRNALAAEGISAHVDGGTQAGFAGVFEIGILVRAEDFDRAKKLIESHELDNK